NLGLAYWRFEDLDSAEESLNKVLAVQPSNIEAMAALQAIALERKDVGKALDWQARLAALKAHSPELSYNLGLELEAKGTHEEAARCYEQTLDKEPEFAEASLTLGHTLKALGKEEE